MVPRNRLLDLLSYGLIRDLLLGCSPGCLLIVDIDRCIEQLFVIHLLAPPPAPLPIAVVFLLLLRLCCIFCSLRNLCCFSDRGALHD